MPDTHAAALSEFRIAIVGGSIAGCAAAIELGRLGCPVTVFERTGDELKDRGAGIGVPFSVIETFMAHDLVDKEMPYFRASSFSRIWRTPAESTYGYLAWDQPANLAALNWGGLYQNLRKRVPNEVYRAAHKVEAINQIDDEHVRLSLADGRELEFDLVVCADGYASLGRRTLFPDVSVRYAGYVLWRGFIDEVELGESAPLENGIRCVGYPAGHGIFYFVPGLDGSVAPGKRLVNWGVYTPMPDIDSFMTDKSGKRRQGSLSPGSMPLATERDLKDRAHRYLPSYYADITEKSIDTFAYAIYDCEVPAYRKGRVCLCGDAGAFARPHSAAGALKGINDAVALGERLAGAADIDAALGAWDAERTEANNALVRFGNQLGRASVEEIPDWSTMDESEMEHWFNSIVTYKSGYLQSKR